MSRSVADDVAGTHGKALPARLADIPRRMSRAGTTGNPDVRSAFLALIRQAGVEAGLSQKAQAINAGCPESHYSEGLNGVRPYQALWLWAQPDAFLLRWIQLVMEARGLTPERETAVRAARIAELVRLLIEEAA